MNIRTLTFAAVCAALAAVLSVGTVCWKMPSGGEISLRVLPLLLAALVGGIKPGLCAGAVYAVLNLVMGAKIFHPIQLILDYLFPFLIIGFSGIFFRPKILLDEQGPNIFFSRAGGVLGASIVWLFRLLSHTTSGAVFFSSGAPISWTVIKGSLLYNLGYLIPELVITIVFISFFPFKRVLNSIGQGNSWSNYV